MNENYFITRMPKYSAKTPKANINASNLNFAFFDEAESLVNIFKLIC